MDTTQKETREKRLYGEWRDSSKIKCHDCKHKKDSCKSTRLTEECCCAHPVTKRYILMGIDLVEVFPPIGESNKEGDCDKWEPVCDNLGEWFNYGISLFKSYWLTKSESE